MRSLRFDSYLSIVAMTRATLLFITLSSLLSCTEAPPPLQETTVSSNMETTYDSTLAAQLGADQYGMRKYVMAYLKRGPNRDWTNEQADSLQGAHMDNIIRMADEGKLVLAGPFFDDGEVRGIYIFAVNSLKEAEALTNSDPAIQAGSLEMELREWYGTAALMQIPELSKRIQRVSI
jgi:uncharacterized protein